MLFSVVHNSPTSGGPGGGPPSATSTLRDREVDLVRAMASGDTEIALMRFYDRFSGMVMALFVRMLGSHAEAEELLQEVFVELWKRAGQYDAKRAAVSTWVITIARSRALDALRARQRRGGGRHDQVEELFMRAPTEDRPDAQAALSARSAAVHAALADLPDAQRDALELAYFEGLSHREIAERLGEPLGTIKSRIVAAMKVLRAALAPAHGGKPS